MRTSTTKHRQGLWLGAALTGVVALVTTTAVVGGGTQAMWAQSVQVGLPSVDVRMVSETPPPEPSACTGDPLFFPEELRLGAEPTGTSGGKDVWAFDWDAFESWGGWARYRQVTAENFNPFDWDGDGFADGYDQDPCTSTTPQPLPCRAGLNTAAETLYLAERGGNPDLYDDRYVDWDEDGWPDAYELGLLQDFGDGLVYYLDVDADGRVTQPPTYNQAFVDRYGPTTPLNIPARSNPCHEPSQPLPDLCVGTPVTTWVLHIADRASVDAAYVAAWFVNPNEMLVGAGPWQVEVKEGAPGAVQVETKCEGAVDLDDLSTPPVCSADRIINATGSATSGTFGDYTTTVSGNGNNRRVAVSWNLTISSQWSPGDVRGELVVAVPDRWVSTAVGDNSVGGGLFQTGYQNQTMTVDGVPVTPTLAAGVAEYRIPITPNPSAPGYPTFSRTINVTFTLVGSSTGSLGLANILATLFVDSTAGDWRVQGASTTVMANTNNSIKSCADVPAGFRFGYTAGGAFAEENGAIVWHPAPPAWFG